MNTARLPAARLGQMLAGRRTETEPHRNIHRHLETEPERNPKKKIRVVGSEDGWACIFSHQKSMHEAANKHILYSNSDNP